MLLFFRKRFCGQYFLALFLLSISYNLYADHLTVHISISGVEDELLKNVQAYLSIDMQKKHPRLSDGRVQRLHKQAPDEIKRALQPFGYYNVNVTPKLTQPKPEVWQAEYHIDLGEPIKLQTVEINLSGDAKDDSFFEKLLADFPVKMGDTLNHTNYETSKRVLRNLAEERGYFDAQINQNEVRVDEQAYTARVLLSFDTKRRYRFGDVKFEQERFDKSFLQRFFTFDKGDYYTSSLLLAFKNALIHSEYFDQVQVNVAHTSTNEELHLPVTVTLAPRKPNKYTAGIGYGTDTGVRGSLGWERRYINRYGHRFSAKLEMSEIRNSATGSYYLPTGKHIDDFLTITAGYRNEITDTSESELLLLGISKNHLRTLFGTKLSEIIGIEYRDEKYTISGETGQSQLLMPYGNWSYLKADDRIYTRRGYKIELKQRGALKGVGSDTSFWQTRLKGAFIYPLLKNGRLIARGDAGYSEVSEFQDLPPSVRFFSGGDRSVRGYDYETLGQKNEKDEVIGGKHLLVGSIEYEHKILEKWSLAAFFDTGNAFNGLSEPLKQGAGVGVRWHSPVGLIRIDVASALSEANTPLRLHIIIGPDL